MIKTLIAKSENEIDRDYNKALYYAQEAYLLAQKENLTARNPQIYLTLGTIYNQKGSLKEASAYLDSVIMIANQKNLNVLLAKACLEKGKLMLDHGLTNATSEYIFRALTIAEQNKIKDLQADANLQLGRIHYYLTNDNYARLCFYKALNISKSTQNQIGIANACNYIGIIESGTKSNQYLLNAISIYKKYRYWGKLAIAYHNISYNYLQTKQYPIAKAYLDKAIAIDKTLGANLELCYSQRGLATYYNETGNSNRSIQLSKQLIKTAEQRGYLRLSDVLAGDLATRTYYAKRYKESAEYSWNFYILQDSINRLNIPQKIQLLKDQINYEIKNKQLTEKNNQQIIQKKQQFFVLSFILSLFLVLSLSLYLNLRRKKQWVKILEEKNATITDQKEQLQQALTALKLREKELEQVNKTKDQLISVIGHDLINPFNTIVGFSEILLEEIDEFNKDEILSHLKQIHKTSEGALELLRNLLTWSMAHSRNIQFKLTNTDVNVLIRKTVALIIPTALVKKVNIESQLEPNVIALADYDSLMTIVRNLLTNAVKFTPSGGKVTIRTVYLNNEQIKIEITDTGVGISEDNQKKILEEDAHLSTYDTEQKRGTGLGLKICLDFAKRNNGTLNVKSQVGKGSTFTIILTAGTSEVKLTEKVETYFSSN
ncbi:MAG: ATP-binding protein [Bacteroidota bacterium]|nr:ATP-binding protein [Bacteroidota bacterium]